MIFNKQLKESKMNPTLINGFEDIVAHIKNQEQRIMALEEKNKKQKQENDEWTKKFTEFAVKQKEIEFKELKEENKKLKEEDYQPKGSRIDPEGLHDLMKEQNDKLKEENKKLKEEHENYVMTHCCDMSCEECGSTTTEDDLKISLKHGSLICEECYHEKENCFCENCEEHCGPNDVIFIFERGIGDKHEDTHFCQACGDDLHEVMRSEGWRRDDDEDKE